MNKDEQIIINTIRTLSIDAVQRANSGHPGTPMAMAPVAFTIWDKFMSHNPVNPDWPNRDRFVLSAGHASMLLYSILHVSGYDLSLSDIKNFRQLHSRCPGHPEYGLTPGVETTTGPLGQGLATSVGMAVAEKWLGSYFNRPDYEIINYSIFALGGDGCMMEGISSEAASFAGHLGLDNLVWIYDNNHITIEGNTSLTFTEDLAARFMGYNWHVQRVGDANDLVLLEKAFRRAVEEKERPSLVIVDSHIGFGSPTKQDTSAAHGEPLGEEEIRQTKIAYGFDPDKKFYVPFEVKSYQKHSLQQGEVIEKLWVKKFESYERDYPKLAEQFRYIQNRRMPQGWECCLPEFPSESNGPATRTANSKILNTVASDYPWLIGGAADVGPSTKTYIDNTTYFQRGVYSGRNFHFGVRENSMSAIANGMALSGIRPYVACYLVFSDYMRASLRLSCLMRQPVIYIFTHDSIGVGEDGPTHQPVEHLTSLRAIPNLEVIRPADANELSVLWKHVMESQSSPVALILSRQGLPTIDRKRYSSAQGALKGAYILSESKGHPDIILIGTGSEVHLCLEASDKLIKEGIEVRVVSMPSWNMFERQSYEYRQKVLPNTVRARVAVEAGSTHGWGNYTGITNVDGGIVGMQTFGESAPISDLLEEFGLTTECIVNEAKKVLKRVNSR